MREVIGHEQNGLLAEFFDVDGLAALSLRVLKDPPAYRALGAAGRALVEERYSQERTVPRLWELFARLIA